MNALFGLAHVIGLSLTAHCGGCSSKKAFGTSEQEQTCEHQPSVNSKVPNSNSLRDHSRALDRPGSPNLSTDPGLLVPHVLGMPRSKG